MRNKVMAVSVMLAGMWFGTNLAGANDFYVSQKLIETDYELFAACSSQCPEIDYTLIDTGLPWLDSTINKAVVNRIDITGMTQENSQEAQVAQAFYAKPMVSDIELTNQINRLTKDIISANNEHGAESASTYVATAHPSLIGMHKGLVLMEIQGYYYLGGNHGLGSHTYYVFDLKNKKYLTLTDIVIKGKQTQLTQKLQAKYHQYLKDNDMDPKEMAEYWEFFVTDNFTFTKEGMEFLYQPYEITPYVMGMPSLALSYQELSGIIKPQYLK
ncbi:MAG: RsiV family protein [Moraxella sp.]|nr:RsiV family protein [Moraxella sp.]